MRQKLVFFVAVGHYRSRRRRPCKRRAAFTAPLRPGPLPHTAGLNGSLVVQQCQ